MNNPITVQDAVDRFLTVWAAEVAAGTLSPQTLDKGAIVLRRLSGFSAAHEVTRLNALTPEVIESFVAAQGKSRFGAVAPAANATQHNRRAVLRMFTQHAIKQGCLNHDPTRLVQLTPRANSTTRALTDTEADTVRFYADRGARSRHAATVATLLAGAHTNEAGYIRHGHVDLERRRVFTPGATGRRARWLPLDTWEHRVLTERVAHLSALHPMDNPGLCTATVADEAHQQARVCVTIGEIFTRAALRGDRTLKPSSLTIYAARRKFDLTGSIESAALLIGGVSLDHTARIIGHRWQPGDES